MTTEDLKFRTPCTILVSGPSQSGKTSFTLRLVQNVNQMFTTTPQEIIWCYGEYQNAFEKLPGNVKLVQGLPNIEELRSDRDKPRLLVVDDLMIEGNAGNAITELACRGSHHLNITLLFLVQNVFYKGQRDCRLNSQYLVLFKSPADQLQITNLAKQMYEKKSGILQEAFRDATLKRHGYLLIGLFIYLFYKRLTELSLFRFTSVV